MKALLHGAIAFVAVLLGSIIGAIWIDGAFSFLRQSLPVIVIAAIAGRVAGGWNYSRAVRWIWIPSALLVTWLLLSETTGWTDRTRPPEGVSSYAWNQFFGPRCGPTECFDAIVGTVPLLGFMAYVIAAETAASRKRVSGVPPRATPADRTS
jgi:hypothetical protein